ncbi:MAG TPA: glycosyltransferase, partial [Actinomycetota bacterium]|nr:glycosyltransferase [Actinomycetota bacterium]
RLVRQKALDVLLEALASLPPKFILGIVGEGYLAQELRERAVSLGVAPRVRWLGWRDDVGDLIAAADVFALSSVWEAVGLAAQEAVQLGTPVVSTDVGGMGELIRDGWSGRLVAPGDPSALARALERTAGKAEGKRLAERAAQDYRRIFSRERTMEQLARAYRELSAQSAHGAGSGSV